MKQQPIAQVHRLGYIYFTVNKSILMEDWLIENSVVRRPSLFDCDEIKSKIVATNNPSMWHYKIHKIASYESLITNEINEVQLELAYYDSGPTIGLPIYEINDNDEIEWSIVKPLERIVCAAIWYKEIPVLNDSAASHSRPKNVDRGVVICGLRHANCILIKSALTNLNDSQCGDNEQGFLTNRGRFVDRAEAAQIFRFSTGNEPQYFGGKELDSSDLY